MPYDPSLFSPEGDIGLYSQLHQTTDPNMSWDEFMSGVLGLPTGGYGFDNLWMPGVMSGIQSASNEPMVTNNETGQVIPLSEALMLTGGDWGQFDQAAQAYQTSYKNGVYTPTASQANSNAGDIDPNEALAGGDASASNVPVPSTTPAGNEAAWPQWVAGLAGVGTLGVGLAGVIQKAMAGDTESRTVLQREIAQASPEEKRAITSAIQGLKTLQDFTLGSPAGLIARLGQRAPAEEEAWRQGLAGTQQNANFLQSALFGNPGATPSAGLFQSPTQGGSPALGNMGSNAGQASQAPAYGGGEMSTQPIRRNADGSYSPDPTAGVQWAQGTPQSIINAYNGAVGGSPTLGALPGASIDAISYDGASRGSVSQIQPPPTVAQPAYSQRPQPGRQAGLTVQQTPFQRRAGVMPQMSGATQPPRVSPDVYPAVTATPELLARAEQDLQFQRSQIEALANSTNPELAAMGRAELARYQGMTGEQYLQQNPHRYQMAQAPAAQQINGTANSPLLDPNAAAANPNPVAVTQNGQTQTGGYNNGLLPGLTAGMGNILGGQESLLNAMLPMGEQLARGELPITPEMRALVDSVFANSAGDLFTSGIENARQRGFAGGAELINSGPGGAVVGPALAQLQGQKAGALLNLGQQIPQLATQMVGAYSTPGALRGQLFGNLMNLNQNIVGQLGQYGQQGVANQTDFLRAATAPLSASGSIGTNMGNQRVSGSNLNQTTTTPYSLLDSFAPLASLMGGAGQFITGLSGGPRNMSGTGVG